MALATWRDLPQESRAILLASIASCASLSAISLFGSLLASSAPQSRIQSFCWSGDVLPDSGCSIPSGSESTEWTTEYSALISTSLSRVPWTRSLEDPTVSQFCRELMRETLARSMDQLFCCEPVIIERYGATSVWRERESFPATTFPTIRDGCIT